MATSYGPIQHYSRFNLSFWLFERVSFSVIEDIPISWSLFTFYKVHVLISITHFYSVFIEINRDLQEIVTNKAITTMSVWPSLNKWLYHINQPQYNTFRSFHRDIISWIHFVFVQNRCSTMHCEAQFSSFAFLNTLIDYR